MQQERSSEHQIKKKSYKCPKCYRADLNKERIRKHISICQGPPRQGPKNEALEKKRKSKYATLNRLLDQSDDDIENENSEVSSNKKKKVLYNVCPYCHKKDKNLYRLKQHMEVCAVAPNKQEIRREEKIVEKQRKFGIKICRYCSKQFPNFDKFYKHVDQCPKKDPIEKEKMIRQESNIEERGFFNGWVLCPCCGRNIRTAKHLYDHFYDECIRNPKNPDKIIIFPENQGVHVNQNNEGGLLPHLEWFQDDSAEPQIKGQAFLKDKNSEQGSNFRSIKSKVGSSQPEPSQNILKYQINRSSEFKPHICEKKNSTDNIYQVERQLSRLHSIIQNLHKEVAALSLQEKLVVSKKILEDNKDNFYQIVRDKVIKDLDRNEIANLDEEEIRRITLRALQKIDFKSMVGSGISQALYGPRNNANVKIESQLPLYLSSFGNSQMEH